MANSKGIQGGVKLTDQATLGLLSELEGNEHVTQRSLSVRVGVALGLTNSLIKRCVRKGLIKVAQASAKRYSYYVTPKGFREKSRLVAEYLSTSLLFYREAKDQYGGLFASLKACGIESVVLCGADELTEIAILAAHEQNVEIQFTVHQGSNYEQCCGYPVYNNLEILLDERVEAIIITSIENPQDVYDRLLDLLPKSIIHDVPLLHISHSKLTELDNG
ncbi:winged helix-turn-helix transcriptional regulator [Kiloniella majae]|uniref:winged helix-turn-helix transcriptional regulator n=1 Tax=Kiloniella majae TaxID=1938558 RepID=UPI000A277767|nr:winged helix-turn-helix transcriptional regulator [Kiloniella majae]